MEKDDFCPEFCAKIICPSDMKITIFPLYDNNILRIGVHHSAYNAEVIAKMKSIVGARWHPENKCWHIPYTSGAWAALFRQFPEYEIDKKHDIAEAMASFSGRQAPKEGGARSFRRPGKLFAVYLSHEDKSKLWIHIPPAVCNLYVPTIKRIHGKKWNAQEALWEVPYTQLTIRFIEKYIGDKIRWTFQPEDDLPEGIVPVETRDFPMNGVQTTYVRARYEEAVTAMQQYMMLKNYSRTSIKSYLNCFREFIRYYDDVKPTQLTRKQMEAYLLFMLNTKHISRSYQSQILSALKLFYTAVVDQADKVEGLFHPKKAFMLPNVLTESEVARLLRSVGNLKHQCILMLIYSGGLRLSEVISLKIKDIQIQERRIFVRDGKGKKDRCTLLSDKAVPLLEQYLELYMPVEWLFEGVNGGQYSARSVQRIFEAAKFKSGINPDATVHTLRHSFATHLLEKGVNLRYIQELLGHNSSKTTEIYTHITQRGIGQIKSPLDHLDI